MTLEVVCWKWRPSRSYRSTFGPDTVLTLRSMVARQLRVPHRFTCVTDEPAGLDGDIRVVDINSLPSARFANVPNPSNQVNPSCYRRLFLFSREAQDVLGERVVSMDLDVVLTDDVTQLFDRREDFAIWGGQSVQPGKAGLYNWFNGSLMYLRTGTRTQVWERFDPVTSPGMAHRAGCRGSDQGWIAFTLGRKEHILTHNDGVYSYRNHVLPAGGRLPRGARFVAFHGKHDPWDPAVQKSHDWIREHYR